MTKKKIAIISILGLLAAACALYYGLKANSREAERGGGPAIGTETKGTVIAVASPWETIVKAIQNCEAMEVFQAHNLSVTAKLQDGRELSAVEPEIDAIMDIAAEAESKCGHIVKGTE